MLFSRDFVGAKYCPQQLYTLFIFSIFILNILSYNTLNSNLSNIGNALCVPASKDITANTEAFKFVTADSKSQFLPKQCNAFMINGSSQKTYPLTLINGIMTPYMGVTIPSGSYMCYYNVMRN